MRPPKRLSEAPEKKDLNEWQKRALKRITNLLTTASTTESEAEYFETSAEAMKLCASVIRSGWFSSPEQNPLLKTSSIPYADQVIEYGIEAIEDCKLSLGEIDYDN